MTAIELNNPEHFENIPFVIGRIKVEKIGLSQSGKQARQKIVRVPIKSSFEDGELVKIYSVNQDAIIKSLIMYDEIQKPRSNTNQIKQMQKQIKELKEELDYFKTKNKAREPTKEEETTINSIKQEITKDKAEIKLDNDNDVIDEAFEE